MLKSPFFRSWEAGMGARSNGRNLKLQFLSSASSSPQDFMDFDNNYKHKTLGSLGQVLADLQLLNAEWYYALTI